MKNNSKTSTNDISSFIRTNVILCEIIGMGPMDSSKTSTLRRFTVYLRMLFTLFAVSSIFVPQILLIAFNWGDIVILTGVGSVMIILGQLLFKIFYLLWRREAATRMYELVKHMWKMSEDDEDARAIEKYARQAKLVTIIFTATGFSTDISFAITAIFNLSEMRRNHSNQTDYIHGMPFDVWYGNEPMSWNNLKLAFGCQFLAVLFCCTGIVSLDSAMMTLVLHVCGQFLLIQCWFRKIGRTIRNELTKENENFSFIYNKTIRRDVRKCVEHHKRMLLIVEEVEELLSPIIFVQFVTSAIEVCLSGFALTNALTSFEGFVKFMNYVLAIIIQLLVWCWPGEILIRDSQAIGETVYMEIPWYAVTNELRMDLGLVIARSQKACQITAMKFQTISIRTLGNIFNTAASYFTLLTQFQT